MHSTYIHISVVYICWRKGNKTLHSKQKHRPFQELIKCRYSPWCRPMPMTKGLKDRRHSLRHLHFRHTQKMDLAQFQVTMNKSLLDVREWAFPQDPSFLLVFSKKPFHTLWRTLGVTFWALDWLSSTGGRCHGVVLVWLRPFTVQYKQNVLNIINIYLYILCTYILIYTHNKEYMYYIINQIYVKIPSV